MLLVNTDFITDRKLQTLGLVKGSSIRTRNVFVDVGQAFKNMIGGELRSYTGMMDTARKQATERMIEEAKKSGADAIINVRYSTSTVAPAAAEVIVYGTAVKFLKKV